MKPPSLTQGSPTALLEPACPRCQDCGNDPFGLDSLRAMVRSCLSNSAPLKRCRLGEVKGMADRIIGMRTALKSGLTDLGSKQNWDHITNQIGMCVLLLASVMHSDLVVQVRLFGHFPSAGRTALDQAPRLPDQGKGSSSSAPPTEMR
jgi:hypothetical protein